MPASMCHYDQHFYAFSQVFTIARQDVYLLKHLPKPGEISVVCPLVEQVYAGIFCLFVFRFADSTHSISLVFEWHASSSSLSCDGKPLCVLSS